MKNTLIPLLCILLSGVTQAQADTSLVALLDSILQDDQGPRDQHEEIEANYGRASKEMQDHWKLIQQKDSLNVLVITHLLDNNGWLGPDVIGADGNMTLFLVIQHADIATQEKYLPMLREAVEKGNAKGSHLALLEDRILLAKGQRQIYGSQVMSFPTTGAIFVEPLDDPAHVDERRASVGLGPIAEYLSQFDLTWDAEAYQKALPELEERCKLIIR